MDTFYLSKINMLKTTIWHIEIMIDIIHIKSLHLHLQSELEHNYRIG